MVRRVSPWVLTLWVSFLALTYLQPCCEAIASVVPHEHPAEIVHPNNHADHADELPDRQHRHCAQPLDLFNPLAIAITASDTKAYEAERTPLSAVLFLLYDSSPRADTAPEVQRGRAPPEPVYLSTLRLRI